MRALLRHTALAALALWSGVGCAALTGGSGNAVAPTRGVIASIPIRGDTILLAINDDGSRIYAAANSGLHVIDAASNQVVATLKTLPNPAGLTITGRRGFLTNLFSLKLSVIDTAAPAIADSISLFSEGTRPAYGRVAAARDSSTVYVVDQMGQNLVSVAVSGQPAVQTFGLDLKPDDVALTADGRWAYVCGCKGFCTPGRVQRFDTQAKRIGESIQVGPSPYRVVLHPDGKTLYTANLGDGSVSVVDLESLSLTTNVTVAPQLTAVAVSNDGDWIYAVSRAANQLAAIDAGDNEVHARMSLGPSPREVVLSPDGRRAYVSTAGGVQVIDTEALLKS